VTRASIMARSKEPSNTLAVSWSRRPGLNHARPRGNGRAPAEFDALSTFIIDARRRSTSHRYHGLQLLAFRSVIGLEVIVAAVFSCLFDRLLLVRAIPASRVVLSAKSDGHPSSHG